MSNEIETIYANKLDIFEDMEQVILTAWVDSQRGTAHNWANRRMIEGFRNGLRELTNRVSNLGTMHAEVLATALREIAKTVPHSAAGEMTPSDLMVKINNSIDFAEQLFETAANNERLLHVLGRL